MRRFLGRTILVLGAYIGLLIAVIIAGFVGKVVGIWASVLWGLILVAAVVLYLRRRHQPPVEF